MFIGANLANFNARNVTIWMSLAFQAGVINTGGYLACHRFVTHTTGFATLFGTEMATGHWIAAIGMLSVPLFFLSGAMIAALFIDHRMLKGQAPRYSAVLFFMTTLMAAVTVGGQSGAFGPFGEQLSLWRDYLLLAILSLTSGLQNAAITSAFGAIIRTTHLTGVTTDFGIGLVRLFTQTFRRAKEDEVRATWMRLGIITFFILGSFSSYVFLNYQFLGFVIPTLISAVLWIDSLIERNYGAPA